MREQCLTRRRGAKIPHADKGAALAHRTFDKLSHVPQAAIIENKRLGAALAFIREQQIEGAEARSAKAPRRRDQRDARLFKVG